MRSELHHWTLFRNTLLERRAPLLDPEDRERLLKWIGRMEAHLESFVAQRDEILASTDLTRAAKERRIAELTKPVREGYRRLVEENAAVDSQLATVAERAPFLVPNPDGPGLVQAKPVEHTAVAEQRHSEIRAMLRQWTPLEVRNVYLQRLRDHGFDDEVVQAIRRTPDISPLVDERTREEGLQIVIDRSPAAGAVRSLKGELAIREALTAQADQVLKELGAVNDEPREYVRGTESDVRLA